MSAEGHELTVAVEASAQQCAAPAQGRNRSGVESLGQLAFASLGGEQGGESIALQSQAATLVSHSD